MKYAIKVKDGYYVNHNLFDTETKPAFLSGWYFTKDISKPLQKINAITESYYELKDVYQNVSESIPRIVKDYDDIEGREDLYERKSKIIEPEKLIPLEEDIEIIKEDVKWKYVSRNYNYLHKITDLISTHDVLLQDKECKLSIKESFDIIRDYVKNNINPEYAKITSDYDFHFAVKKLVKLAEEQKYEVDINNSIFDKRKKKPKYVTKYRKYREILILDISTDGKFGEKVNSFYGKNYKDLEKNIKSYLENIIKEINKPYIECSSCNGMGVVTNGLG